MKALSHSFLAWLGTLSMLFLASCREEEGNLLEIAVRDGSGTTGAEILNAAYALSASNGVAIQFDSRNGETRSVVAYSRKTISKIPCDWATLSLRGEQLLMNDEPLTRKVLRDRLSVFAESARLAESEAFFLVSSYSGASGKSLVSLFDDLVDAEIFHIIPQYTERTTAEN